MPITCWTCEDAAVVCKLCGLPGTRCNDGRKYRGKNCPACTPPPEPKPARVVRVRLAEPKFSITFGQFARGWWGGAK